MKTKRRDIAWALGTALLALAFYLLTLQWHINGSASPYATDAGEIQNALPRWGTVHSPGYPLYSFTGSAIVTGLRLFGVPPAAGASLVSALWGALTVGLLVLLARRLGASPVEAALAALATGLTLSTWIDASLAEVHSLSAAFTVGTLLAALAYSREPSRRGLVWLALVYSQAVAHQRALALMVPGLAVWLLPHWRHMLRHAAPALAVSLLAPLTYLYLPLREWMGADWAFGQTSTWQGFWTTVLDLKVERIVEIPQGLEGWVDRGRLLGGLLHRSLPWPLFAAGLAALWFGPSSMRRSEGVGLLVNAGCYLALSLMIWEGDVSDALLAAKLPALHLAGLGLGLTAAALRELAGRRLAQSRVRALGAVPALGLAALSAWLAVYGYPQVTAITRDRSAFETIALAEQVADPQAPTVFMALWGHDYWALAYAQTYEGRLAGLQLVDHNAHFERLEARKRLLTLERTLHLLPPKHWEERLGAAHLSSPAPGIVEIASAPRLVHEAPDWARDGPMADLGIEIDVLGARVARVADGWTLQLAWRAASPPQRDYAVAVHLVAHSPPRDEGDVLAQADSRHPVHGWYPTSRWQAGEVVLDAYLIASPADGVPEALRVALYYRDEDGRFVNSRWLTLPL